jgi:hypothetical protein
MEFEFEEKQGRQDGREQMSQEPRTSNLVDTTDCLEAVSVIRCWKNFLFIIVILGMVLLQGLFWMMNLKLVKPDEPGRPTELLGIVAEVNAVNAPAAPAALAVAAPEKIKKAAKEAARDANAIPGSSAQAQSTAEPNQPHQIEVRLWFEPRVKHITALVRFLNFVLIPSALLYCLTMLLSLKLSLIGRLGGINHIARAFFLSLVFVVLLLPWQLMFAPVFGGVIFTSRELITACEAQKTSLALVSFYLRFTGYWVLVLLVLLFAQIRSMRWARATLRRLEIV